VNQLLNDETGPEFVTTSGRRRPRPARDGGPGTRRGARLPRYLRPGSPLALTAAAGLVVATATTVVDTATPTASESRVSVVFERQVNLGSQVFVTDLSGTRQRQLTFGPSTAEMPRWAPFGHRILYLRRPANDAHLPDLMVMDPRGRHRQQLLTGGRTHFISDMAWSPSGRRIVLVRTLRDGFSDLFIYTVTTDTLVRMRVNSEPARDPATVDWSPDGRIFFSAVDYTHDGDLLEDHDLYVVRPNGTGLRQLTDTPLRDELLPRVSPDGRRLAYAKRSGACSSVRIAGADASASVRLPTDCLAFQASWSPRANRVLVQKFNRQGEFVLRIMAPDGSDGRFLTNGENAAWRPAAR
jgi:Tol biopolymer transport system component